MLLSPELPYHPGELHMQNVMKAPTQEVPTSPFLTPRAGFMLQRAPLLALGTLDSEGRPWTTVWGSETPFAQILGDSIVGVKTMVDARYDPVVEILMQGKDADGVVKLDDGSGGTNVTAGQIRRVGGLTIDLETRSRVKLAGNMMVGVIHGNDTSSPDGTAKAAELTLITKIEESLGNCPKYLNKKHIVGTESKARLASDSIQLSSEALSLIEKADLFFVTSSHEQSTMDTSHRGGHRGFTRVLSNEASGAVIAWPEYSGNRLYQTLGNFITTPLAGLVFPDFETGDVLYLTGVPEVVYGLDAAAVLPRSNLIVKMTVTGARFVQSGLSFRGEAGEESPYNPAVRYASVEKTTPGAAFAADRRKNTVTLIDKKELTPTITRYRFRINDPGASGTWKAGQYATLAFADELDLGYSHMREDDPLSINDDYVRTFTVSSPPSDRSNDEFELTIRKVGSATTVLSRQNARAGFELPLLGFEGEFRFETKAEGEIMPVIAAGIGITPVLGQLKDMNVTRMRLLWTSSVVDIGLVADTFERCPELSKVTTLFITGNDEKLGGEEGKKQLQAVKDTGVRLERRRIEKGDVDAVGAEPGVDEWYMCVGPALKTSVLAWLSGQRVEYENFDY